MKKFILILLIGGFLYNCSSTKKPMQNSTDSKAQKDTLRIANDSLNYEIIIFETGFKSFLATQPSRGYYSQNYLESHNYRDVVSYNGRVLSPSYSIDLYPQQIDYEANVDYGYEVNYLLYYYFRFFEKEYGQKL